MYLGLTPSAPAIAAIVATYNRSDLLRGTLESLVRQTLSPSSFEVVIVDDGSSDRTREVVREFGGRLAIRYAFQHNAGLASARNHGLYLSSAPIALFLDDDDIAGPRLLDAHLDTHRRHPEDHVAVLGYTNLEASVASDPLMHFVTEVGCFLFSYPNLRDGDMLDFSYFWGGRSSCKRAFLIDHGVFNPVFRFGCEDIELAYRLSVHGLRVAYNASAVSTMVRNVTFDQFCNRLIRQGRSNAVFSRLHDAEEVQQWTEVREAQEAWPSIAASFDSTIRSARQLDRMAKLKQEMGFTLQAADREWLHRSYWTAFRAAKKKGIIEGLQALPLG